MLLPMMDSVPKPCKKGREVAHPADGRLHAEGGDLDWIRFLHPQEGVVARQAYLAGCEESFATLTVARALPWIWSDLTSEVLEWLSSGGKSA
jgi:hypothetical protein